MSPSRVSPGGSFRLNVRFPPPVGRITNASSTTSIRIYRRLVDSLHELYESGQLGVLQAFRRGEITPAQILEARRHHQLTTDALFSELILDRPLWRAVDELLPVPSGMRSYPRSLGTRRRYWDAFKSMRRGGLLPSGTIRDLATVDWDSWRARHSKSAADWNHWRRALSWALTSWTGDVYSPFRRAVMTKIKPRTEREREVELPAEVFWRIVAAAPEPLRPAYVTLAATGMRLKEYMACTKDNLDAISCRVRVPGTKTAKSFRWIFVDESMWPWVVAGIPAPRRDRLVREHFKRAIESIGLPRETYRLHDLRHLAAQLASDEGVSPFDIRHHLGHTTVAMTARYLSRRAKKETAAAIARGLGQKVGS